MTGNLPAILLAMLSSMPVVDDPDEPPMGVRIPATRPPEQFWNAAGTGIVARWSLEPMVAPLSAPRTLRLIVGHLDNPDDIVAPDLSSMSAFSRSFRLSKPKIELGTRPAERAIVWTIVPLRKESDTIPALPYRYFDPKRRVADDRWELRFPTAQAESLRMTIIPDAQPRPTRSPLVVPAMARESIPPDADAGDGFRIGPWLWMLPPLLVGLLAGYRRWRGSERRAVLRADRYTRRTIRRLRRAAGSPAIVRKLVLAWCEDRYGKANAEGRPETARLLELVDRATFSREGGVPIGDIAGEMVGKS